MPEELRLMLADPHARHAMLIHVPIVLGAMAWIVLVAALARRLKDRSLIVVAVVMLGLASLFSGLAATAGEEASESLDWESIPAGSAQEGLLKTHEDLGEGGWKWPLIPAVLACGALLPMTKRARVVSLTLATVGAMGVAGWISLTAHRGGQIVYVHGLGVPAPGGDRSPPGDLDDR